MLLTRVILTILTGPSCAFQFNTVWAPSRELMTSSNPSLRHLSVRKGWSARTCRWVRAPIPLMCCPTTFWREAGNVYRMS